ncbi:nuclear transport factor 2 family protein [Telmatobacter sp. DSM 110680]|uniref:Nuclear transport factor 2 family protein n=1 Tax=Telmatobacter sp. DSM 110680 TaxID=3036704 RepID=A0AAU7DLV8_9BACT
MRVLVYLMLLCGASSLLAASDTQNADKKEITALIQELVQMDKQGSYSPQFVQDHISSDLRWAWPGGRGGRDEYIKTNPSDVAAEERVEDLKFRLFPDVAVVDGVFYKKNKGSSAVPFKGYLLEVWAKQDGHWKLVNSATGPFPDMRQAVRSK